MKTVTKIDKVPPLKTEKKILRVAAYCRVSTDSDAQLESLETQKKHYESRISEHEQTDLCAETKIRFFTAIPAFFSLIPDELNPVQSPPTVPSRNGVRASRGEAVSVRGYPSPGHHTKASLYLSAGRYIPRRQIYECVLSHVPSPE